MNEQENESAEETEIDSKVKYTLPQLVFMLKTYVKNNESATICRREFRATFPGVPTPEEARILRLAKNFRTSGLLIDANKIGDKHIEELENEAEEIKKRKVMAPCNLESNVLEDQNSFSEGGTEDVSSTVKTEIKSEPPSSPEHETTSNGFEFVHIKKEPKDSSFNGEESTNSSNSNEPSVAHQAQEWGLVEENPLSSAFTTPDPSLPYPCRHCGRCFKTYTDLKSHISEVHAKVIRCGECGKEFPSQSQLQRHEMQHAVKPPFTCIECKKEFLTHGRLTAHIKKAHVKREKSTDDSKTKRKKKK